MTHYDGDHIDLSAGTFHEKVVGSERHEHHHYGAAPTALAALPGIPQGFTGRDQDLERLLEALCPHGDDNGSGVVVSAVAGMGGVGKTALAVTAGHTAANRGWFSATLFVNLRGYGNDPVGPGQALESLLRALGVPPEHIPPTEEERAGLYRSMLEETARARGGPVLVVADNAARHAQVAPLLPGGGGHRLLVTSRDRLHTLTGARHLGVDVLDPDAAVALLSGGASAADPADTRVSDTGGLRRLAAVCGGLPLALEICAALLVRSRRVGPGQLADRLTASASLLDGLDDGQRAVRAVFDESYERLAVSRPDAAEVFILLGLNPGPDIATGLAAVLAGMGVDEVAELLEELAAASLLTLDPETDRWSLHDLLADYARHRLMTRTEEESEVAGEHARARGRLLEHYAAMAEAADAHVRALPGDDVPEGFTGRDEALAWLDEERANLRAVVETAQALGLDDIAIDLPLNLAEYLGWRRYFDDCIILTTIARDTAQQVGDRRGEAGAWTNLGVALREVRRFDEAMEAMEWAISLYAQTGDDYRKEIATTALEKIRIAAGDTSTTCSKGTFLGWLRRL